MNTEEQADAVVRRSSRIKKIKDDVVVTKQVPVKKIAKPAKKTAAYKLGKGRQRIIPQEKAGKRLKKDTVSKREAKIAKQGNKKTVDKQNEKKITRNTGADKQANRCDRALAHRLFLLGRRDSEEDFEKNNAVYIVMGTTGNIYYPKISTENTTCSCIDQRTRKGLCKHLLFILIRVLKFPTSHPIIVNGTSKLSREDVDIIRAQTRAQSASPVDVSAMAPESVRSAFSTATGVALDREKKPASTSTMRELSEDEDCPICYESMTTSDDLLFCRSSCRRAVHKECWSRWEGQQKKNHEVPSCVYCRAAWVNEGAVEMGQADQPIKRTRINLESFV